MKTYARVVDGRVVEVIQPVTLEDGTEVPIAERFHPDILADLVECPPEQQVDVPEPPVALPRQVTMRQARLALLAAGKLQLVDGAIAGLPSPQKEAAQIEWEFAAYVDRESPIVALLGPALALDAAAMDELFMQAALL